MSPARAILSTLFVSAAFALAACSSGGGGGGGGSTINTSAATVTAGNQNEMATASAEGSKKAIESSNAPIAALVGEDPLPERLARQVHDTVVAAHLPVATSHEADLNAALCPLGGSVTINIPQNPGPSGSAPVNYMNCQGQGYTINGTSLYTWSNNFENFTYTYDLTVSDGTRTYSLRGTVTCTGNGATCTYREDFNAKGRTYRVENVSVSGNNTSGYTVNVRVYDAELGYVDINATGITICSNGNIGSGTIQVTDSTGTVVLRVDFPNCDQMTITFGGNATTVAQ